MHGVQPSGLYCPGLDLDFLQPSASSTIVVSVFIHNTLSTPVTTRQARSRIEGGRIAMSNLTSAGEPSVVSASEVKVGKEDHSHITELEVL